MFLESFCAGIKKRNDLKDFIRGMKKNHCFVFRLNNRKDLQQYSFRDLSSAGLERFLDREEVGGSNPLGLTSYSDPREIQGYAPPNNTYRLYGPK